MPTLLRLYDASRRPAHWTEIIRPGEYAAFAKIIQTSAACDAEGRPFSSADEATCLVFDDLHEAEAFCREQVLRALAVRFEIFDAHGRLNPPLLVVVHPEKVAALEGNPRGMRTRKIAAAALAIAAVPLVWCDYAFSRGRLIFPTVVAINLLIVAARLIQLNRSYAHAEQERARRLAEQGYSSKTVTSTRR
jgi:hypothetical protein